MWNASSEKLQRRAISLRQLLENDRLDRSRILHRADSVLYSIQCKRKYSQSEARKAVVYSAVLNGKVGTGSIHCSKNRNRTRTVHPNRPRSRSVARIFRRGECVPQEPGPNILMFEWYAMQAPKIHRAEWPTYGVIEIGTSINWYRKYLQAPKARASVWRGLGACPLRKFSNLKALKCHFQHSQAESCVKKVPKIDRYFLLNLTKQERCHKMWHIFIIENYCHTPFNAREIPY